MSEVNEINEIETPLVEPVKPEKEGFLKRGRGRPKKVVQETPESVVADTPIAIEETPKPIKKKKPLKIDKDALTKQIKGWHDISALVMRTPELKLDDDEAEMLTDAVVTLAEEYGIAMSGKTAAWLGLIGTAGMVYVPRAIVIKKKIDENRRVAQATNVSRFTAEKVKNG